MQNQYLRSVALEPILPQSHISGDSKPLSSKLAIISNLVSSLNAAVEELESFDVTRMDEQFDFYQEVERFQINLIKKALRITGGSQVKAARLLKLNPTTLNAKMKTLNLLKK